MIKILYKHIINDFDIINIIKKLEDIDRIK